MIYFDTKSDKFIDNISKEDVTINFNNSRQGINTGADITLRIDYSHLKYFKEWLIEYQLSDRNIKPINYKRDIFISSDNRDIKFLNCMLKSLGTFDYQDPFSKYANKFEVVLLCDYYEMGVDYKFPELIALYRDKKLDILLN